MAHILVIDDEPQIRSLIRVMLESEGHQVTDAADGKQGLRCHRERPADLVILDLIMPNKEGIETIIELKRECPDVKIIAISGGGRNKPEGYLLFAKELGATRTFTKPFRKAEFLAVIEHLLQERSK